MIRGRWCRGDGSGRYTNVKFQSLLHWSRVNQIDRERVIAGLYHFVKRPFVETKQFVWVMSQFEATPWEVWPDA